MRDVRTWLGGCGLVVLLACTVGEAPPQGPVTEPATEPAPEVPAGDVGGVGAGAADAAAAERASQLLSRAQLTYEAAEVEEALRLAGEVLAEYPGTPSAPPARWLAARAAFATGRYSQARELALEYASGQVTGSRMESDGRSLAELAADALETPAEVPVVGVVLPRTGPRVLVAYADWLLEGIELAVAEAERTQNRRIELIVADDGGGARVAEAVRELERRGAVAVIGPMLPEQIAAAARARSNPRLVLVSPTATEVPQFPQTFSINSSDTRGAQELGRYAAEIGLRQAAVLYPRIAEFERKAQAFTVEFESMGGEVRALVPYDSGTTTFGSHMRQILAAVAPADPAAIAFDSTGARLTLAGDTLGSIAQGLPPGPADSMVGDSIAGQLGAREQQPFALFVPAPQRDVPQIAPQVAFYGLDSAGVQVLGDEAWASATVRRVVPNRDLEGVIAASRFPPGRAGAAWDPAFVTAYEQRYRKSLDNQLPALGYDAAHLVMQALPSRILEPEAFARRFQLLAGIRGATGLLSVRADRVVRAPYVVIIRGGELAPAPYPWEYDMPEPKPPLPDTSAGGER